MYVTPTTTIKEIKDEIRKIDNELNNNYRLSDTDRCSLREQIEYLESFLPVENW